MWFVAMVPTPMRKFLKVKSTAKRIGIGRGEEKYIGQMQETIVDGEKQE